LRSVDVQETVDVGIITLEKTPPPLPPPAISNFYGYPNPFSDTTTITFALAGAGNVNLRIYTIAGELVRSLLSGAEKDKGKHEVKWDGRNDSGREVASGTYLYKINSYNDVGSDEDTFKGAKGGGGGGGGRW
jgi:hypothetical protein